MSVDRQTDKQKDRKTERQKDRQTERQKNRHSDIQSLIQMSSAPKTCDCYVLGCSKIGAFFGYPCTGGRLYVETLLKIGN